MLNPTFSVDGKTKHPGVTGLAGCHLRHGLRWVSEHKFCAIVVIDAPTGKTIRSICANNHAAVLHGIRWFIVQRIASINTAEYLDAATRTIAHFQHKRRAPDARNEWL